MTHEKTTEKTTEKPRPPRRPVRSYASGLFTVIFLWFLASALLLAIQLSIWDDPNSGYLMVLVPGQLLWVVPLYLRAKGNPRRRQGLIVGVGLIAIIAGGCWSLIVSMSNP